MARAVQWRRAIQTLHRWLGLILGAQVLLWMASGVVMSWFHIDLVRGETTASLDFPIELQARSYASPGGAIARMGGAQEVRLRTFLGKPVYEVTFGGDKALFSALTGARISPISEAQAREIATKGFIGDGEIRIAALVDDPPPEYRGRTPVWRIDFDDPLRTRLYIPAQTGEIAARRNRVWRLYDFFWMLHIMDYEERENFNNPLIRAASATGLAFALTGLALVLLRLCGGRYRGEVIGRR